MASNFLIRAPDEMGLRRETLKTFRKIYQEFGGKRMTVREVAGKEIEFDDEGFMADPDDWSQDVANILASDIGVTLGERHWTVIEFCRSDYQAQGESPTLRRITKEAGVPTKELYQLFPKGPAKKVAYVSGLGKPTGCI